MPATTAIVIATTAARQPAAARTTATIIAAATVMAQQAATATVISATASPGSKRLALSIHKGQPKHAQQRGPANKKSIHSTFLQMLVPLSNH